MSKREFTPENLHRDSVIFGGAGGSTQYTRFRQVPGPKSGAPYRGNFAIEAGAMFSPILEVFFVLILFELDCGLFEFWGRYPGQISGQKILLNCQPGEPNAGLGNSNTEQDRDSPLPNTDLPRCQTPLQTDSAQTPPPLHTLSYLAFSVTPLFGSFGTPEPKIAINGDKPPIISLMGEEGMQV